MDNRPVVIVNNNKEGKCDILIYNEKNLQKIYR